MKTYLVLFFNTEGANPTEIMSKVNSLGFGTVVGAHDLVFEWDKEPTENDILEMGNKVREALKGTNTFFKLETV